jgi:hypothetical protein
MKQLTASSVRVRALVLHGLAQALQFAPEGPPALRIASSQDVAYAILDGFYEGSPGASSARQGRPMIDHAVQRVG